MLGLALLPNPVGRAGRPTPIPRPTHDPLYIGSARCAVLRLSVVGNNGELVDVRPVRCELWGFDDERRAFTRGHFMYAFRRGTVGTESSRKVQGTDYLTFIENNAIYALYMMPYEKS